MLLSISHLSFSRFHLNFAFFRCSLFVFDVEKKPKELREEAERRVLSFSEFAYFVAEASRGRGEGKKRV